MLPNVCTRNLLFAYSCAHLCHQLAARFAATSDLFVTTFDPAVEPMTWPRSADSDAAAGQSRRDV